MTLLLKDYAVLAIVLRLNLVISSPGHTQIQNIPQQRIASKSYLI